MTDSEKPSVYLAGAVKENSNPHTWREQTKDFIDERGFLTAVDPLEKYDTTAELDTTDGSNVEMFDWEIVEGDLDMLREADGVLAYHPEACETWGTPMELFYARLLGKPIALVWRAGTTVSPWAQAMADWVGGSWINAIRFIATVLTDANLGVFSGVGVEFYNPQEPDGTYTYPLREYVESHSTLASSSQSERGEYVESHSTLASSPQSGRGEYVRDKGLFEDVDSSVGAEKTTSMIDEGLEDEGTGSTLASLSGDELAGAMLDDVESVVNNSRDTHGDAVANQEHIAQFWTTYLQGHGILHDDEELTGADVACMMGLLKMSRMCVGEYAHDHLRDIAGYASIGAACQYRRGNGDDEYLTGGQHE